MILMLMNNDFHFHILMIVENNKYSQNKAPDPQ